MLLVVPYVSYSMLRGPCRGQCLTRRGISRITSITRPGWPHSTAAREDSSRRCTPPSPPCLLTRTTWTALAPAHKPNRIRPRACPDSTSASVALWVFFLPCCMGGLRVRGHYFVGTFSEAFIFLSRGRLESQEASFLIFRRMRVKRPPGIPLLDRLKSHRPANIRCTAGLRVILFLPLRCGLESHRSCNFHFYFYLSLHGGLKCRIDTLGYKLLLAGPQQ